MGSFSRALFPLLREEVANNMIRESMNATMTVTSIKRIRLYEENSPLSMMTSPLSMDILEFISELKYSIGL